MALQSGDVISASDFINLKARVKAECARRKYNGSVASYANSSYDYTTVPSSNSAPLPEHFNKIITPMNAMVNTGRSTVSSGSLVEQLNTISTALTRLEGISATASNGGCKSSCTGLCQGTCSTGCSGCSGSCTGGCKNSCSGGCAVVCYDGCDTGCYSSCDINCSPQCSNNCYNSCKDSCDSGCKGRCKGSCMGDTDISPY